jgi:hypothetical protein
VEDGTVTMSDVPPVSLTAALGTREGFAHVFFTSGTCERFAKSIGGKDLCGTAAGPVAVVPLYGIAVVAIAGAHAGGFWVAAKGTPGVAIGLYAGVAQVKQATMNGATPLTTIVVARHNGDGIVAASWAFAVDTITGAPVLVYDGAGGVWVGASVNTYQIAIRGLSTPLAFPRPTNTLAVHFNIVGEPTVAATTPGATLVALAPYRDGRVAELLQFADATVTFGRAFEFTKPVSPDTAVYLTARDASAVPVNVRQFSGQGTGAVTATSLVRVCYGPSAYTRYFASISVAAASTVNYADAVGRRRSRR